MRVTARAVVGIVGCGMLVVAASAPAQDWPQWRGANRDAKATGFKVPAAWPQEPTQKWKVTVGEGVATPALVGDRLYVFARQDGHEITRCLNAATGAEIWQDKYESGGATGPAQSFSGPRSSPTVSAGKVITFGVRGTLSCLDAANGTKVWRKEGGSALPRFFVSSSPMVVGNLVIAQLGGEQSGSITAFDLASGAEKWNWADDGSAYASPVLLAMSGTQTIVAETAQNIVGIGALDGKLLWKVPFAVEGRGYNACTPAVSDTTVIFSGSNRGTRAVRIEKQGDELKATELWANRDNSVQFNSPVIAHGLVFGISDKDILFCIGKDGKTAWTAPVGGSGGGRGRGGYGSLVDAGSVLFALPPSGNLVVFEANDKEFKKLANYKVAESDAHAYPVVSGNRLFIKDRTDLTLWTIE